MKYLKDFIYEGTQTVFKNAKKLPPFFENNLVDPGRVVKVFRNDPQANIRGFYFQYLKLCFEEQTSNYDEYIFKFQEILNNETFKFMFYQDDDPQLFNDHQFKHLIMEFFSIMVEEQQKVEDSLNKYPIMDTVFVYFFRSLLILTGKTDSHDSFIQRGQLLDFLSKYFNVEISFHKQCLRFVQTDVFLYQQNQKEVFMAFILDEPAENDQVKGLMGQAEDSPQTNINNNKKVNEYGTKAKLKQSQQSYVSGQFIDYTSHIIAKQTFKQIPKPEIQVLKTNNQIKLNQQKISERKYNHNQFVPASIKNKQSKIILNDQQPQKITKTHNGPSNPQIINSKIETKIKNNQSMAYVPVPPLQTKYNMTIQLSDQSFLKQNKNAYDVNQYKIASSNQYSSELFSNIYKPLSQTSKSSYQFPKLFSQITKPDSFKTISTFNSPTNFKKENPFGLNVSEQFTNSLTMKAMCEPFKSNVITIRQKARMFRNSLKFTFY